MRDEDGSGLILASASPRRRILMERMGLDFAICPAEIDEREQEGESPVELVVRLSREKAHKVAAEHPRAIVVAADTIVVQEGRILGKPAHSDEAFQMLLALRGRRHNVFSGLYVSMDETCINHVVRTPVCMRSLSDKEIADYVASGSPLDKAGAYAIQDGDFAPVASIGGCYANVIGLPLCHLYYAVERMGQEVPEHPLDSCPWAVVHGGCRWAVPLARDIGGAS